MNTPVPSLQTVGLKSTPVRRDVLGVLRKATTPLSVDEILEMLQSIRGKTDRVTVYRTINTLCETQLLRRVEFGQGRARYELAALPHHHHLICQQCGLVEDTDVCLGSSKLKQVEQNSTFVLHHHAIDFYGLCGDCQLK